MTFRRGLSMSACAISLACVLLYGCGGEKAATETQLKNQNNDKLDSMKQLGELAGSDDRRGIDNAVESFSVNTLDAKANPDVADEILQIYNSKVKGKIRGEAGQKLEVAVNQIQQQLK